jgi:RNA polymerase sigma-70 factor (ECF subfamily)
LIFLEDIKLANKISSHSESDFNHFFELYFPRLYRFTIVRIDGDEELTKEIVQETLISAIKNIKQYRGEAALFSWLCQINRNHINQYFRKNKLLKITSNITDSPNIREVFDNIQDVINHYPDKIYENDKLRDIITSTLDNLPNGYGDILEWKYLDKLSVVQIAEKLDTSEISIQSKLARARKSFKQVIINILGNDSDLFSAYEVGNER